MGKNGQSPTGRKYDHHQESESKLESELELNLKGTQILNSDSRPRDDKKRKRLKERRYQYVSEMTKDLREALRNASGNSIRYRKTFESQKDLVVKTIVPNLMKILDLDTYLIGEENDIKKETGQKHQNSQ
ncbi:hypothetical protein RhiirC2_803386 [Rhizophagus irregularis]|uniref:Uncharacterized protein n=1 Tax=Rhizophagus irregularis TaxID=588596 RepID=A0A2N1LLQ1_9GLOM|nr:hypothetical protein RhiirC2_803386 [Rhizophagus irregularis]